MESAALFLLTSSLSVVFGWQPMPDGSPKVEYIVQIDPALAATLRDGQSIPITSDIPDDIGPIGRIRIQVGSDDLPKQNLVTSFKPWPKNDGLQKTLPYNIVETQFTVPPVQSSGAGRYGTQPASSNQILPPGGNNTTTASNPFARTLQQGAQDARSLANDVKQQILPPSGNQLFGSSGNGSANVQNAIQNTADQFNRGVQQGVAQVADRTGQQLRQAVDNTVQRTEEAVDRFGRSLAGEQRSIVNNNVNSGSTASNSAILPPSSNTANQTNTTSPTNPPLQPPSAIIRARDSRPSTSPPATSFAASSEPPAGSNPTSPSGVFNAPWPATNRTAPPATTTDTSTAANTVRNPPYDRYDRTANQTPTQPPAGQNYQRKANSFDLASRQPSDTQRTGNNAQPSGTQFGNTNSQLRFPNNNSQSAPRQPLPQTGNQALQTVSNTPDSQRLRSSMPASNPGPQDFNWPQGNDTPTNYAANRPPAEVREDMLDREPNSSSGGAQTFPLILSWVGLSGSLFANFYLFWNYMDVRGKYQGIVHGSPLRRERYDD